jgi:RNA polymerase sigma factor (sigma-70 family)
MPRPDPSKLATWYGRHAAALTLYARQLGSPATAEDAVQEAFVHLLAQPREPDNVRAWLFKTVRNEALTQLRSSRRRDRREREVTKPDWFLTHSEDLIDASAAQAALAKLPDEQREVVVLRIWGQASFAEAAEITGSPLSSVYDRYRTGLAALKQLMESSCVKKTP